MTYEQWLKKNGYQNHSFNHIYKEAWETAEKEVLGDPIPMLLWCPQCKERHIDKDTSQKNHTTHMHVRNAVWCGDLP